MISLIGHFEIILTVKYAVFDTFWRKNDIQIHQTHSHQEKLSPFKQEVYFMHIPD